MRITSMHSWRLHYMLLSSIMVTAVASSAVASPHRYSTMDNTWFQQKQLQGTVKDASGNPIQGVSVEPKNNPSAGTITDESGKFVLQVSEGSTTLVFRSVGFISQEVTPTGGTVAIILQTDDASIDEVVVVGYGTQKKESVTG